MKERIPRPGKKNTWSAVAPPEPTGMFAPRPFPEPAAPTAEPAALVRPESVTELGKLIDIPLFPPEPAAVALTEPVQTKLTVGESRDKYEQKTDRTAVKVTEAQENTLAEETNDETHLALTDHQNSVRDVVNLPLNITDPLGQLPVPDVIKRRFGDPGVYTDLAPWQTRELPYLEEQRQWALDIVCDNAEYICETANHFNVTPDAIAGAILWEALENPYHRWGRGQNPLGVAARPGTRGDFGIPGKIHVGADDVAAELDVELAVRQRNPNAFRSTASLEERLLSDDTAPIDYIGAILNRHAESFERVSIEEFGREEPNSPLGTYPIRDQAGLLGSFYQGVNPEAGARAFETRRNDFLNTGDAVEYPPFPYYLKAMPLWGLG